MSDTSYEVIVEKLSSQRRGPTPKELMVTDAEGWSVAHYWARQAKLGEEFKNWDMADNDGWTVAHSAAQNGNLPSSFNQWLLTDKNGDTVAHIAVRCGKYDPKKFGEKITMTANNLGVTVWDEIKKRDQVKLDQVKSILKK